MPSSVDLHVPQLAGVIDEWWHGAHPTGVPPHVTLLYPWVDRVGDRELAAVAEVASLTPAFTVTFTEVRTFDTGVVYLLPEPQSTIRALMRRLADAFPETPLYDGAFRDPQPHLTVAKTKSTGEAEALRERISRSLALPFSASIEVLSVMEQRDDDVWHTIDQPSLRRE